MRAALAEWARIAPDRFPGIPDWSDEWEWRTHLERQHAAALDALAAERQRFNDELDQRTSRIRAQLDDARSRADLYERALLTTDSDQLVHAVIEAFRELGFSVIDVDQQAAPGDKLEDLHITDSDQPGWLALAEVKGYTKGVSTTAFQQLARFSKRYLQRTGGQPDAEWYIANQFRTRDPAVRQPILHGKDEDVRTFAADGGLVVDTVVLFRVLDLVRSGQITSADARAQMRASSGVLTTPAAPART